MLNYNMDSVVSDMEPLLRTILRAIENGTSDVYAYVEENELDENSNSVPIFRGDRIRINLAKLIQGQKSIFLIPYKRSSWNGYFLRDDKRKIILSICSAQMLRRVFGKKKSEGRKLPHYVPTFNFALNNDLKPEYIQMKLSDISEDFQTNNMDFLPEEYMQSFWELTEKSTEPLRGYHYFLVSYEIENQQLVDVGVHLYDGKMEYVERKSLAEFIQPDYSSITMPSIDHVNSDSAREPVYGLISVKPGLTSKSAKEPEHEMKKEITVSYDREERQQS